jgi:hypothetical protein
MRYKPITLDDEYSYPIHTTGAASTLPYEEPRDLVAELHEVVKEITGQDVQRQPKARIGFLP